MSWNRGIITGVRVGLMQVLFLLALLGLSDLAAQEDATPPRPRAAVTNATFNFGTVAEGDVVSHDFEIENHGSAELALQRVVATCGCTAATTTPGPIPPGGKGTVHVEFKSAGFAGQKTKNVHVFTNDPDKGVLELSLTGIVQPEIEIAPTHVDLGEISQRELSNAESAARRATVRLRVRSGSGATLGAVRSLSPRIVIEKEQGSGRSKEITIAIAPSVPFGDLRERVLVDVVGGRGTSVVIPVFAAIRGDIKVEPAVVSFGIVEGTDPLKRSIKVRNMNSAPLAIDSVESSINGLTTRIREVEPGKLFSVELVLQPANPPADIRGTLKIATTVKEPGASDLRQEVVVNVYGIAPPPAS